MALQITQPFNLLLLHLRLSKVSDRNASRQGEGLNIAACHMTMHMEDKLRWEGSGSNQSVKPTDLSRHCHCSDSYPAPSVALTSLIKCTRHMTDSRNIRGGGSINYFQFIKLHTTFCEEIQ